MAFIGTKESRIVLKAALEAGNVAEVVAFASKEESFDAACNAFKAVLMEKAKLVVENDELKVWEYEMTEQEFSKTNTKPFGSVKKAEIEIETDGENPQHMGVLRAWGGAILRGTPLVAEGAEGINGLTLSNAMHLSSFTGKTIELPFDEELYYEELMKRVATSEKKETVKEVVADTNSSFAGTK